MQAVYTRRNLALKSDEWHRVNEENVVPFVEKVLLRFLPKLRSSSQLNPDKHYDWHKVTEQMQVAYTRRSLAFKNDEQYKVDEKSAVPIVEKVLLRFSSRLRPSSQLNPDIYEKVFLEF